MKQLWIPSIRAAACLAVAVTTVVVITRADVLPEDRADVMFHRFDGGGVTVEGPSVLVRKKFGDLALVRHSIVHSLVSAGIPKRASGSGEY